MRLLRWFRVEREDDVGIGGTPWTPAAGKISYFLNRNHSLCLKVSIRHRSLNRILSLQQSEAPQTRMMLKMMQSLRGTSRLLESLKEPARIH